MKPEKSETLSKQAEAALRKEQFRLLAVAPELNRDQTCPRGKSKAASPVLQRAGWFDEARWMINNNLTSEKKTPDFLDYVYEDGLKAVKPEAVNIIR